MGRKNRNKKITKAETFYVAENYHQDYYIKNGEQPYCRLVILPKMEKLEKLLTRATLMQTYSIPV